MNLADNILIVYFSWAGNTRKAAQAIQTATGGELFEVLPQTPYPSDYTTCVNQAEKEVWDDYRPPLKEDLADITAYDLVFVCSPNWWGSLAPPMATFLAGHSFAGKRVAPFCSHGGGGAGRTVEEIEKLCPDAVLLEGLQIVGSEDEDEGHLNAWLKKIGVPMK